MEITYESIKPIILEENWTGNQVNLKFKAKNAEQALETVGIAMPSQEEMMKKMAIEMAKMTASNVAVGAAGSALGNMTGIAGAGSAITSAASQANVGYQMDPNAMMQVDLTPELKETTIVNAFKTLENYFEFKEGEWSLKPFTS
jgi:hypothetical protein